MLTKHLSESPEKTKGNRSSRAIITNEARALRELRLAYGLSMRRAGELIGVSDSYISHIENGRTDFPRGQRLDKFLSAYGGIKQKSFYEKVRNWKDRISPLEELVELVSKLNEEKIRFLMNIARNL